MCGVHDKGGLGGGGVIQGTASESTHMALLSAKAKTVATLLKTNPHWKASDIRDRLVVYASDQVKLSNIMIILFSSN